MGNNVKIKDDQDAFISLSDHTCSTFSISIYYNVL